MSSPWVCNITMVHVISDPGNVFGVTQHGNKEDLMSCVLLSLIAPSTKMTELT